MSCETIVLQAHSVIAHLQQVFVPDPGHCERYPQTSPGSYVVVWSMMDTATISNGEWLIRFPKTAEVLRMSFHQSLFSVQIQSKWATLVKVPVAGILILMHFAVRCWIVALCLFSHIHERRYNTMSIRTRWQRRTTLKSL